MNGAAASADRSPASSVLAVLAIRVRQDNPNHHLWNNNGTWFVHYTVHRPDFTKARVRQSLGTRSLAAARLLRDRLVKSVPGGSGTGKQPSGGLVHKRQGGDQ